ncbi:MAG: M48 family metalloprotease [Candidatus Humimicrobiaceae bacterium]|jgi:heat shock protein HtpX|nr:M48 family metalloprotease [Actinomycetota bacterium]MDY0027721.1 M48 family metalloprotease [Candidatus Humimicrobiaceae bacterium]
MYEQIAKNKAKSVIIIIGFVAFITVIGFVLGYFIDYENSIIFMIFALIIAAISSFSGYYYSDKMVLGLTGARPLSREENPRAYYMVEGLSIAAGIPTPKIYVISDKGMNAFATGRNPQNGVIVLTEGLLENLNDEELKGVISHELAHIKNYDILLGTIVAIFVGMISIISNIALRSFFFRGGKSKSNEKSGGGILSLIFLLLGILLIIFSPLIATIIRLAISRNREFLADSTGVLISRYPAGLASALKKISESSKVRTANNATAHLFIANPFGSKTKSFFSNLFSTHPPVEERIKRLESMSLGVGV